MIWKSGLLRLHNKPLDNRVDVHSLHNIVNAVAEGSSSWCVLVSWTMEVFRRYSDLLLQSGARILSAPRAADHIGTEQRKQSTAAPTQMEPKIHAFKNWNNNGVWPLQFLFALPFSWLEEMLSSSFGFATCVIMDVLSMETRCYAPSATPFYSLVDITKCTTVPWLCTGERVRCLQH